MRKHKLRHILEYWGLLFLIVPWYYLPRSITLRLGSGLGWFVAHFIPIRRQVVQENLQRAFPNKSGKEIKQLTVKTYRHFGRVFADFIKQDQYELPDLETMISTENQNLVDEALKEESGVVLLLGHFGNWELLGRWLGLQGYPTVALHRPQNNPLVDKYINDKRRGGLVRMISIFESTSAFIDELETNNLLFMLADQDARKRGVFVNFFDIPSSTPRGAAVFAYRQKAPVVLAFPVMNPDNTYHIIFERMPAQQTGSSQAIRRILQQYMYRLQFHVSEHPEQYFWFHRRWKTQPVQQQSSEPVAPNLAGAPG